MVAAILEGLGFIEHKADSLGGVVWIGKDLHMEWYKKECEEHSLKRAMISLEPLTTITEEQLDQGLEDAEKSVLALIETPTIVIGDLTEEQHRSVVNQKIVCKCGTTKMLETGGKKTKAFIGGKRRMRCNQCAGCKAPKCNECQFCLKAHLKKPCTQRVCLFPKIPKCPCFA
jgi:hypothetical protein